MTVEDQVAVSRSAVTICNPINIEYRFSVRGKAETCFREAADPSVVFFAPDDAFYLFPSVSGGYWRSTDLVDWSFIPSQVLPTEDYAPDVRVLKDGSAIYFTASRHPPDHCPIFKSATPKDGNAWEKVSEPMPYWDPNMFQDDDGKIYVFHGCTNKRPMYGLELDSTTMLPKEDPSKQVPVIYGNAKEHGWERLAENNDGMDPPYVEGAWMDKHNGRYYLQYASPSTLINVYNDGVYESDESPLGPFRCAPNNPFSFKPGGFMTGAGHGSTFRDRFGNLWHISTMRITVHHYFERRIGLWPAGFDEEGVLFCNTRFGDYPIRMPDKKWQDPWEDPFPKWMLLSFKKAVTVSSHHSDHPAEFAVDENSRTWWVADKSDQEPWLQIDMGQECTVHAVQVNFAESGCDQYEREGQNLYHQYLLESSASGSQWSTIEDKMANVSADVPHDYISLRSGIAARFVRIKIAHMPGGGDPAISGLRVFGQGPGTIPQAPQNISIVRDIEDPCIAEVTWAPSDQATGYNVRWGIASSKLYLSWMVMESTHLVLRCLNAQQKYCITVEAFNQVGASPLGEISQI